jgi:hypothetical protein
LDEGMSQGIKAEMLRTGVWWTKSTKKVICVPLDHFIDLINNPLCEPTTEMLLVILT